MYAGQGSCSNNLFNNSLVTPATPISPSRCIRSPWFGRAVRVEGGVSAGIWLQRCVQVWAVMFTQASRPQAREYVLKALYLNYPHTPACHPTSPPPRLSPSRLDKERENTAALSVLEDLLRELDAMPDPWGRLLTLIEGR